MRRFTRACFVAGALASAVLGAESAGAGGLEISAYGGGRTRVTGGSDYERFSGWSYGGMLELVATPRLGIGLSVIQTSYRIPSGYFYSAQDRTISATEFALAARGYFTRHSPIVPYLVSGLAVYRFHTRYVYREYGTQRILLAAEAHPIAYGLQTGLGLMAPLGRTFLIGIEGQGQAYFGEDLGEVEFVGLLRLSAPLGRPAR